MKRPMNQLELARLKELRQEMRELYEGLSGPIPANPSHSDELAAPTLPSPVLDPLNWKELPDDQDPLQLCQTLHDLVDYWRERALKAEAEVEYLENWWRD